MTPPDGREIRTPVASAPSVPRSSGSFPAPTRAVGSWGEGTPRRCPGLGVAARLLLPGAARPCGRAAEPLAAWGRGVLALST